LAAIAVASSNGRRVQVLEDLGHLLEAGDLAPGDVVLVTGRRTPLDGGGAAWSITEPDDGARAPDGACVIGLSNGLWARLGHESRHDVRQAGVFADQPGSVNAAGLLSLVSHMLEGGGGTVEIAQPIPCDNVVFPPITQPNPITFDMLGNGALIPSDPRPGVFVWDFPADGTLIFPAFRNVLILGDRERPPRCNGIRIGASNRLTVDNCFGRFIEGCAWQIEGANNARIDITTFECGTPDGVYAQNHIAHAGPDRNPNDVVFQGTSERDIFGINVEGGVIFRDGSAIKLHGSERTRRALRLHRCNAFDLKIYGSQKWTADGFIEISDQGSPDARLTVTPDWMGANTRGRLQINTLPNCQYVGTGHADWLVVNLQSPGSLLQLSGIVLPQPDPAEAGATYRHLRLEGPGNPGVTLDMQELLFTGQIPAESRVDDQRAEGMAVRNAPDAGGSAGGDAVFSAADIVDGRIDLKGRDFATFSLEGRVVLHRVEMDLNTTCTLCVLDGTLRVKNSPAMQLAGREDFVMRNGATLTMRRTARNRFNEIARSQR
ncbi:MAG: hypothetical protein AAF666_14515, partial [Pseudomonadota bacterium]